MSIQKNFEYIKTEIYEVLRAIKDGESDVIILDSYEYENSMLEFLKKKDKQWFKFFFGMIQCDLTNGATYEMIMEEMNNFCEKSFVLYISNIIFDKKIIEPEAEHDAEHDAEEQQQQEEEEKQIDIVKLEEAVESFKWRDSQINAVLSTISQLFSCGIHNQIMGAGKTFIILNTIWEHFKLNPDNKKLYIITCFRQEILKDLFFDDDGDIDEEKAEFLRENKIIDLDKFKIINRVHEKKKKIKLSKTKPSILIVNTDYLRSIDKGDNIEFEEVNFIIFDECHSVSAVKFYDLLKKIKYDNKISIIGFSATPLREKAEKKLIDIFSKSFDLEDKNKKLNIISNYDFISAIKDNVILPPYYILCEINETLNGKIGKSNKDITKKVLENTLKIAPYKKIIGWCKSKEKLKIYYKFIKENFPNLNIYCSTCFDDELKQEGFNTNWYEFTKKDNNSILLCINRGREGSDIKNLDVAIYLDVVKKRSLLVALQTSGRVLRKDKLKKKTHGLIIDTFVNVDRIQIEQMTAKRIIGYYKQIFALCDENEFTEQKETYNKMLEICNNIEYNEEKETISVKIDDDENHDMKFKLELKTKSYDFNKMKLQIAEIIDKMFNIDKKQKFDVIIDKLKNSKWFNLKTINFWSAYNNMLDKNKIGLPEKSDDLYNEYKDFFDNKTWYDILELDTSCWYNFSDFKKILRTTSLFEKYQKDIDKYYSSNIKKLNQKMPINPCELYKIKSIYESIHS